MWLKRLSETQAHFAAVAEAAAAAADTRGSGLCPDPSGGGLMTLLGLLEFYMHSTPLQKNHWPVCYCVNTLTYRLPAGVQQPVSSMEQIRDVSRKISEGSIMCFTNEILKVDDGSPGTLSSILLLFFTALRRNQAHFPWNSICAISYKAHLSGFTWTFLQLVTQCVKYKVSYVRSSQRIKPVDGTRCTGTQNELIFSLQLVLVVVLRENNFTSALCSDD